MASQVSPSFDYEEFEDTLHQLVSEASDMTSVWARQGAPQPAYPFNTLHIISGPTPVSPLWETLSNYAPAPVDNVEMEYRVPCEVVLEIQTRVSKADSLTPSATAQTLLSAVQAAILHTDYRNRLNAKNISIMDPGVVKNLDTMLPDNLMSWAMVEVTLGVMLSTTEYVSYIEHVDVGSDILHMNYEIEEPEPNTAIDAIFSFSNIRGGSYELGVIHAGHIVSEVALEIDIAFNEGVTFTIGDASAQGRLMSASENVPSVINNYKRDTDYKYLVDTTIRLYVSGTATKGHGTVIIYTARPE